MWVPGGTWEGLHSGPRSRLLPPAGAFGPFHGQEALWAALFMLAVTRDCPESSLVQSWQVLTTILMILLPAISRPSETGL